jgi:hypothetical protein
MDKKKCRCQKPAKFYSKRLGAPFCSDKCYEEAQTPLDINEPHIVVTRKTGAYFKQGEITFHVDEHNLDKVLGAGTYSGSNSCLDLLLDSQVTTLALANGLSVTPFVYELVKHPLHGIIQMVWYRDLKHNVDFKHLEKNQIQRIRDYNIALASYKPGENGEAKRVTKKASMLSTVFRVIKKHPKVPAGRATQMLSVIKSFPDGATLAQIIEAAPDKVKTKQPIDKICTRFVGELMKAGAVEEVK